MKKTYLQPETVIHHIDVRNTIMTLSLQDVDNPAAIDPEDTDDEETMETHEEFIFDENPWEDDFYYNY